MLLNSSNIVEYLENEGYKDCKIIFIRNLRNFCAQVKTHKGNVIVKQSGNNNDTFVDATILSELQFYDTLKQKEVLKIQQLAPQPLNIDIENQIIVLEYLDEYKNFNTIIESNDYNSSYEFGVQIGKLHTISIESCLGSFKKTRTEGYFRVFDYITPEAYNAGGPLFGKCIELMQKYPDLNEGIKKLSNEFLWENLIHGDLKKDNIVFNNLSENQKVKVFDWELISIGDKYLDIGYAVSNYLLWWIENMKFSDSCSEENDNKMIEAQEHIFNFIKGYLFSIEATKLDFIKLTKFCSIALLNIFYSKSMFKYEYSKQDIMLLEVARKMLVTPHEIYTKLFMKPIMIGYEKKYF